MRELKEAKAGSKGKAPPATKSGQLPKRGTEKERTNRSADNVSDDVEQDESASDSDNDEQDEHRHARSSKHAPTAQSSKHQVTRKRAVIDAPKRKTRDPRFGPMAGAVKDDKLDANYAFLTAYQTSEMSDLKTAMKKTKSVEERETLGRELMAMQNRRRARDDKERRQAVVREHRRKEKEAVKEGKKPYYLKQGEIREKALVGKFEGMKGKERERAIERRRRKDAQREKKSMPRPRRVAG